MRLWVVSIVLISVAANCLLLIALCRLQHSQPMLFSPVLVPNAMPVFFFGECMFLFCERFYGLHECIFRASV
jgi:uncharacterized membrane protein